MSARKKIERIKNSMASIEANLNILNNRYLFIGNYF